MPRHACRLDRRTARTLAIVAGLAMLASVPAAGAAWDVKPDPPAEPVKLEIKPNQSFPMPSANGIWPLYPTTPSAFVSVGANGNESEAREVWDLRTFERTGSIKGQIKAGMGRLSPDGKLLAAPTGDKDADRVIEFWSFADGQRAFKVEPKPKFKKIITFDITPKGRLVVALELEKSKVFQTYDVKTGAMVAGLEIPEKFQDGSLALSPGGRYAAFNAFKQLVVVEVETGKVAGTLAHEGMFAEGMAFSHDGTELAGLFNTHLLVWDMAKGEPVVDENLTGAPNFYTPGWTDSGDRAIDWLPDGSAWLFRGHALVNRKDTRWVWNLFAPSPKDTKGSFIQGAFIFSQSVKMLDVDHVLGGVQGRNNETRMEVATIPWPQIDASLKAIEEKAPALLAPGGAVSLQISANPVRYSTPKDTADALAIAVLDGLAAQEIKVAEGQQAVLTIKHSEEPGEPYRIVGPGLVGTGNSVISTKFTTDLSLTLPGGKAPVWSSQKIGTGLGMFANDRQTGGRVDEAGMRQGGFEGVKTSLKTIGLPYFIPLPKDKNLVMLPGTIVLTPSPPSARKANKPAKAKVEKPTMRGKAAESGKKP